MSSDLTYCVWRYKDCAIAPSCARAVTPMDGRDHSFIAPSPRGAACEYYVKRDGEAEKRNAEEDE